MSLHARGVFCGAVLLSWLATQDVLICPNCSYLVANSRAASHSQHCTTNLSLSSALLTHVSPSTTAGPVPAALSEPTTSNLPSLEEVCELKCPTLRFVLRRLGLHLLKFCQQS